MKPFAKKISLKSGRFYTVKQIELLFQYLGLPYSLEVKKINVEQLNIKTKKYG